MRMAARKFEFWRANLADLQPGLAGLVDQWASDGLEFDVFRIDVDRGACAATMVRCREDRRFGIAFDGQLADVFNTLGPKAVEREIDAWLNGTEYLST